MENISYESVDDRILYLRLYIETRWNNNSGH